MKNHLMNKVADVKGDMLIDLRQRIGAVLSTLTPKEEKILRMRFGIKEASEHSLERVAEDFEAARGRIREIEQKALRKLRRPC